MKLLVLARRFTVRTLPVAICLIAARDLHAESVKLADGTSVRGVVTEYYPSSRSLELLSSDGQIQRFDLDDVDSRSVYGETRRNIAPGDALAQLRTAHLARDIGLFAHALRHYEMALKADPKLQQQVAAGRALLSQEASRSYLDRALQAVRDKDRSGAKKWLRRLADQFPESVYAAQAHELLAKYDRGEVHPQELSKLALDRLQSDLRKGRTYLERMITKNREAKASSRGGSWAVRRWSSAIKDGEKALALLEDVHSEYANSQYSSTVTNVQQQTAQQLVEVHLNLASHYMARQSYAKAMSAVNASLAIDEKHQRALDMRVRIEQAAGSDLPWWLVQRPQLPGSG